MRITDRMVVSEGVGFTEADVRKCLKCGHDSFFVPQRVTVFSKGGARRMNLWTCEKHPLPDTITDDPTKEA
jgi:hypothetical protein